MSEAQKELEKAYKEMRTKRSASRNEDEVKRLDASLFLVIMALGEPSKYDHPPKLKVTSNV